MDADRDAATPPRRLAPDEFDRFYDEALPVVYGYLLRLCGGDEQAAWDLTQDTWTTLVDQLARGRSELATIPWLISVARSRYLDGWRRHQRLQRKLRLVWAASRDEEDSEVVSLNNATDHISACTPQHRVVLMLAYVDDLPVAEIATLIGSSLSATYALLGRARDELRRHLSGDRDD